MRFQNISAQGRLPLVDALRGLAVLLMLMWHSAEGWVAPAARAGAGWQLMRILAGVGAPLFLLLAGASVVLRWRSGERRGEAPDTVLRGLVARGILIIMLGYTLRLQMWLLDSLAFYQPWAARAWVPAAVGLGLTLVGVGRADRSAARALRWMAPGAALFALGLHQVHLVAPSRLEAVLRVDVLQAIGASLVAIALTCRLLRVAHRPARASLVALAALLLTPLAQGLVSGTSPEWITGWLATAAEPTSNGPARFPLLPWLAYPFVGAAVGVWWDRAATRGKGSVEATVIVLAVVGAVVAVATWESLPHGWQVKRAIPWSVPLMRAAHRVGWCMVLAAAILPVASKLSAVRTLGRASLVVYWVHLEAAFGIVARPIHHRLEMQEWLLGLATLTLAMYGVARFRLGPFETWRGRAVRTRPLSAIRALL